jgi:hypothetical protein
MAERGWITSEVKQEYLQNLLGQGYMIAAARYLPHVGAGRGDETGKEK